MTHPHSPADSPKGQRRFPSLRRAIGELRALAHLGHVLLARCCLAAGLLCMSGVAHAQSVTRATFLELQEIQELMEAEQLEAARTRLEALASDKRDIPYDFAVTNQYLAHASVLLDDLPRARSALEAALASPELPEDLRGDMNLFYGSILVGAEEFALAREALEKWYAVAKAPTPGQLFSLAYANYMSGEVARAEPLLKKAIAQSENPLDSWYQVYYRALFDLKKFDLAEAVLKELIARDPAKLEHWKLLASHYLQRSDNQKALAAIMVPFTQGSLEQPEDLKRLVTLYAYVDAPARGARILDELLSEKKLPQEPELLTQLGNLWLLARERAKAIEAFERAVELAPDASTLELLGSAYFEAEDWEPALRAYKRALRSGDVEDSARISFLAGVSAFRAGSPREAEPLLRAATKSKELRPQAESVLAELSRAD